MDVLRELGPAFLGSRLKRLSERLQSGAARIATEAGLQAQPSHMSILAALEGAPLTIGQLVQAIGISQPGITRSVGQLVELGFLKSRHGADQRQRTISLTAEGKRALARAKRHVWPPIIRVKYLNLPRSKGAASSRSLLMLMRTGAAFGGFVDSTNTGMFLILSPAAKDQVKTVREGAMRNTAPSGKLKV